LVSLQTVDLTAIVERLEAPSQSVLVRIIDSTYPLAPLASLFALIAGQWAHNAKHLLAYTVFLTFLIFLVVPVVLMSVVWWRNGATIEERMKRLRGLSPLSIDGVSHDLTDIGAELKKVLAQPDSEPFHQRPTPLEHLAIGALFVAPLALIVFVIGLNPEPWVTSSLFAYAFFAFDVGFYYLLVSTNHSRGKHAWSRTLLNQWRRSVGYLSCLAITAGVMVVTLNLFPPTPEFDKDHPAATYPLFGALLFMLSPKLFGDQPNGRVEDVMSADRRAPVLFLRSFEDEQMAAAPSSMMWSSQNGARVRFYIMVLLRHFFESIGPVVAIADPRNPAPPIFDAARSEVPKDKWREVAAEWIELAALIVMMGGRTAGTKWELRHIIANGHLSKMLLILPPPHDWRSISAADRWANVIACFDGSPYVDELAKIDPQLVRAIAFKRNDRGVAFLSQTATDTDYQLAGMLSILAMRCTGQDQDILTFSG
jgi:hypothetical protein